MTKEAQRLTLGVIAAVCGIGIARGESGQTTAPTDFRDASFEDLAGLTISSVSKAEEDYFRSAAAATVITDEDIRRSGASTLPEVLRMAPGIEVGQINSRSYAVTMRGFNGTSANKLLPMVDGRSLYSARFGGTIWELRDLPLEDVQQIEVVGGPGGTTWGTNAVNGVINIITKDARQTQGAVVSAGGGIYENAFVYVREGFEVGPGSWMRVYAKAFARDETEAVAGGLDPNDSWAQYRAGFRYDQDASLAVKTTFTGDVFVSRANQVVGGAPAIAESSGGHLLGRHERILSGDGKLTIQGYYDRFSRDSGGNVSDADVGELELRHEFEPFERQRLTWGLNGRLSRLSDKVTGVGFVSAFSPDVRYLKQGAFFVQDEIALTPETLTATVGAKAEYNDFTGVEFLPSARLAWTPTKRVTLWAGYSRAVRIPSRFEDDQSFSATGGGFTSRTLPNDAVESETLDAFEAGLRNRFTDWITTSVSVYLNDYSNLITGETLPPALPLVTDSTYKNMGKAHAVGAEMSATLTPVEWWRLVLTWSVIDLRIKTEPGSTDIGLARVERISPQQQIGLRSLWNMGKTWELDAWLRWVDELPSNRPVPAYTTMDLRIGKQLGRGWEVSLVARNLFEPSHPEFVFSTLRSEVPRSVFLRVDWHR